MPLLTVENINKSFGDVRVLRDVSFTLEKGEVLAVIGKSGGGKTTMLRCLNSLETADSGRITVGDEVIFDSAAPPEKKKKSGGRKIGLVFQAFNLFPQYTVMRNLTLAPTLTSEKTAENRKAIDEKAKALLEKVGLSEKAESYPSQLSGGQQQRVAIARALMLDPEILCFDEPTSALDPELTGEVLGVIRALRDSGRTMIIVTHEMDFARNAADRVIFFADGVIEEEGSPEEVFGAPKSEKLRAFLAADA